MLFKIIYALIINYFYFLNNKSKRGYILIGLFDHPCNEILLYLNIIIKPGKLSNFYKAGLLRN